MSSLVAKKSTDVGAVANVAASISNTWGEYMVMNLSLDKKAVSWRRIMAAAQDAYLVQLSEPIDLTLEYSDGRAAGLPTMQGIQNFVVIPLDAQLLDGFHLWGLTLPTIEKPMPTNAAKLHTTGGAQ